jgi:polysaccharide export outer membrane protein
LIPIRAGDIITVPRASTVYVIGDVKKPGAQSLNSRESITVLEAVSAAEGVLPSGSPSHARLLRRDPQTAQRVEVAVDVKRIMSGKAENLSLLPDDILLIPRNNARAVGLKTIDAAIALGTGALIYR